jgi:hypothetical protein
MPWAPLTLSPGLNVELTATDARGTYTSTNLGRFKAGRFQKIGGWTKYYPNVIDGVPRATHAWQDLSGADRLAVGTTTNLVDITADVTTNITPQTITTTPAVSFTTTAASNVVVIVDAGITNVTAYDAVYFDVPISVDTIILHGLYQITAYLSAHSYSITAATAGAAGVTAGGAVPTFTATSGEANVTVTLADHGLLAGDDIVFKLPTAVGGLTVVGRNIVQSVTSSSAFVITAANAATSTPGAPVSMNAGLAGFTYHIAFGPIASGTAYGVGSYGAGAYGSGVAVTAQTGTAITPTDYSLGNWGELLIATPEDGGIYYWGPSSGYKNAAIIPTAPVYNTGAFISNSQQMIIAYGSTVKATIGDYQDPLMVKWCDSEDLTTWTAASTNQAGSWRIATGSRCIGGATTANRNLIWTDLSVWAFDYIGSSLVFSVTEKGTSCGLIAKHAHGKLGETIYWMSNSGFWSMAGDSVNQLLCPVWDAVFQDLDMANVDMCHTGANSDFTEVMFFYPSASGGLGYCDKYAKFNVATGEWDIGNMQRNTWMDRSVVGNPVATTNSGLIYKHEDGYDADNAPILSSFETAWFYIGEGEDCFFIDRIMPDFKWGEYGGSSPGASIKVTIKTVQYAGDTPKTFGPFTLTQATQFVSKRMRARQAMFRIESDDMGSFWRLGHFRMRYSPDGRGR